MDCWGDSIHFFELLLEDYCQGNNNKNKNTNSSSSIMTTEADRRYMKRVLGDPTLTRGAVSEKALIDFVVGGLAEEVLGQTARALVDKHFASNPFLQKLSQVGWIQQYTLTSSLSHPGGPGVLRKFWTDLLEEYAALAAGGDRESILDRIVGLIVAHVRLPTRRFPHNRDTWWTVWNKTSLSMQFGLGMHVAGGIVAFVGALNELPAAEHFLGHTPLHVHTDYTPLVLAGGLATAKLGKRLLGAAGHKSVGLTEQDLPLYACAMIILHGTLRAMRMLLMGPDAPAPAIQALAHARILQAYDASDTGADEAFWEQQAQSSHIGQMFDGVNLAVALVAFSLVASVGLQLYVAHAWKVLSEARWLTRLQVCKGLALLGTAGAFMAGGGGAPPAGGVVTARSVMDMVGAMFPGSMLLPVAQGLVDGWNGLDQLPQGRALREIADAKKRFQPTSVQQTDHGSVLASCGPLIVALLASQMDAVTGPFRSVPYALVFGGENGGYAPLEDYPKSKDFGEWDAYIKTAEKNRGLSGHDLVVGLLAKDETILLRNLRARFADSTSELFPALQRKRYESKQTYELTMTFFDHVEPSIREFLRLSRMPFHPAGELPVARLYAPKEHIAPGLMAGDIEYLSYVEAMDAYLSDALRRQKEQEMPQQVAHRLFGRRQLVYYEGIVRSSHRANNNNNDRGALVRRIPTPGHFNSTFRTIDAKEYLDGRRSRKEDHHHQRARQEEKGKRGAKEEGGKGVEDEEEFIVKNTGDARDSAAKAFATDMASSSALGMYIVGNIMKFAVSSRRV